MCYVACLNIYIRKIDLRNINLDIAINSYALLNIKTVLGPIDLFPHTSHYFTVIRFDRIPSFQVTF